MNDAAPAPPPEEWKPTLRQEFILVGIASAILCVAVAMESAMGPGATTDGSATPVKIMGALACVVGQAGWITMDRKRRGREVGVWRWLAILFGPLAIVIYLALEYRGRALYLIPLCLGIYVAAIGLGAAGGMLLGGRVD